MMVAPPTPGSGSDRKVMLDQRTLDAVHQHEPFNSQPRSIHTNNVGAALADGMQIKIIGATNVARMCHGAKLVLRGSGSDQGCVRLCAWTDREWKLHKHSTIMLRKAMCLQEHAQACLFAADRELIRGLLHD